MTEALGNHLMEPIVGSEVVRKYEVRPYNPSEAGMIFHGLERPNWAPWLRASEGVLAKRAEVFPQGQIAIWERERPVANISLARFNYDGDPQHLKTWDELMGDPPTGEGTFDLQGNALGMMSINVSQGQRGGGLTTEIFGAVRKLARELGVGHIMGSFRPTQFGDHSIKNPHASFKDYVDTKRPEDKLPIDGWLRILTKNGMRMLRVDDAAMVVPDVSREQFDEYRRTYNPDRWKQISLSVWRCGETGIWLVGEKSAVYAESNVWGILENGNNLPSK